MLTWLVSWAVGRRLQLIAGAIVLAGLVAGYLGWRHHVYGQGYDAAEAHYKPILAQRDGVIADQTAAALRAKAEADSLTATLQALSKQLGDDRAKAKADLAAYQRSHPLNVWVCNEPAKGGSGGAVPESGGTQPASAKGSDVFPPPGARNIGPELDALMTEAQEINEALRSCEVAYEAVRVSQPD